MQDALSSPQSAMDSSRDDLPVGGGAASLTAELASARGHMQQQQQHPVQAAWCAGCNGPITEQFLLQAVDRCWHTRCLKCHHCSIPLSDLGSSCFARAGMILCRNDYIRLFGSHGTCAGCSMHIPATDFVLRSPSNNRVYHVQCFICSQCRCPLQTGDRYALLPSGLPVCETDFAKAFASVGASSTVAAASAAAPTTASKRGGGGKKKGGGQKQQPPLQPVC